MDPALTEVIEDLCHRMVAECGEELIALNWEFLDRICDNIEEEIKAVTNAKNRKELLIGALNGKNSSEHKKAILRSIKRQIKREDVCIKRAKKKDHVAKKRGFDAIQKPDGLRKRLEGVSLGKDDKGYFVYTHRASSKRYPSPEKIPLSKIAFIRSTG
jgi:hypothetical protein